MGLTLEFETPRDGGDPLACVSLAGYRFLVACRTDTIPH